MPISATASLLANRGVLRLEGQDRHAFLQGLISNDVTLCTPDALLYAALLTPQGKFLHDMFIMDAGDYFLIDCEAERADDLLQRLSSYKLRANVTLNNVSNDYEILAFLHGDDGLPDPRLPALGSRSIVEKEKISRDVQLVDASVYDQHRLALGVTDGSRDMIVGKSTLSDGNIDLLHGISWNKGCYVGQELTARMHHRALVKKRMFPVKIDGTLPIFGSVISMYGSDIGEMRSSNGDLGLALLNLEQAQRALAENWTLDATNAHLTPYQPDWWKI